MSSTDDYVALIAGEHADKPLFVAAIRALTAGFSDLINTETGESLLFDIATAVGDQLDIIGEWVGLSRTVTVPLPSVFFSFDIAGLGFDEGAWKGPYDPTQGLTNLDDTTYRSLLIAKIAANYWDGTAAQLQDIYTAFLAGTGSTMSVNDRQDMSMDVTLYNPLPPAILQGLITGGYLPPKPEGVRVNYFKPSITSGPIFSFDMNNSLGAGFDTGVWATQL